MLQSIEIINNELVNLRAKHTTLQAKVKEAYAKWQDNMGLLTGDFAKDECKFFIRQRDEVSRDIYHLTTRHDNLVEAYCAQGDYELAVERGEI